MDQVIIDSVTVGSLLLLSFASIFPPRPVNRRANQWLGLFLFALACALLNGVIYLSKRSEVYVSIVIFSEFTRFAMAPALYLSVLSFTTPGRRLMWRDMLHFIPFFLFAVFLTTLLLSGRQAHDSEDLAATIGRIIFYAVKVQAVLYWIFSFVSVIRYQKKVGRYASTVDAVKLDWLKYFLLGTIFIVFLWFNEVSFILKYCLD